MAPASEFFDEWGFGVCGFGKPKKWLVTQTHLDEIPAVEGADVYIPAPLIKEFSDKPRLAKWLAANNVHVLDSGWFATYHCGFHPTPNGAKLAVTPSYCVIIDGKYAFIDESSESTVWLQKFRQQQLVPIYHWQSRLHIDVSPRLHPADLPDGYMVDNRVEKQYASNVIPKCVASLADKIEEEFT
ncbi:MAG: hypothetical protein NWF09_07785 [Candidatus Bathyarchaeota archaeon]|nr:hypothetical protein [Candidatus Bathyarchaeota archaeon]